MRDTTTRQPVGFYVRGTIALLVLLGFVVAAQGQGAFGGKRGQSLRLAGIIEPPSCTGPPCLGILKLQVDQTVRPLGVTMAQTKSDEGMFIFRGFALQSGQPLRLLAPKATVQPFLDAPPGTSVTMWGLFQNLDFVVAQLTVESTASSTPTAPTPTQ